MSQGAAATTQRTQWVQDLSKPHVPELEKTFERYLAALKPVLSAAQYEQTKTTVQNFLECGEGQTLQQALHKFANERDNWVTELWIEDMYLANPLPLPINSNPFYMLPKQNFTTTKDQLRYAARFIQFCFRFKHLIDNELLPQDFGSGHGKGVPLCMSTYKNFFRACRIPGPKADQLHLNDADTTRHFVVASKNQFFAVYLDEAEQKDEDAISKILQAITMLAKENERSSLPMGVLTTENRRRWSEIRSLLRESSINRQSLDTIENSLFVICLDETGNSANRAAALARNTQRRDSIEIARLNLSYMAHELLSGAGTEYNTSNRWFDKFLQIVVASNGMCGLVIEHTGSEGITVLRFLEEFLAQQNKNLNESTSNSVAVKGGNAAAELVDTKKLVPLKWDINDDVIPKAMKDAAKKINSLVDDLDLYVLYFSGFGKQFIKEQRISPDAFVQLALQLTYYKVHHRLVSTYESAGLRQFRYGRVDNIRSATQEALDWARAMCDDLPDVTEDDKVDLFVKAVARQIEILKYTIAGNGPDNHLLGLREMSRLRSPNGSEPCGLFREKAYKEYLNYRLSTSQLPTDKDILVGYGAVVPDGYGAAYNPLSDSIVFCITSFFSCAETGSDFFARSLEGSLLQMRELCLKLQQRNR